jgi:hypothetical protein
MRDLRQANSAYDLTGCYGQGWRQGLLSDHVGLALDLGFRVVTLSHTRRLVCEDGLTFPVVCSEIVMVDTEDGPIDGRCGLVADLDGFCEPHAAQVSEWRAMSELERALWERTNDLIGA